MCRPARGLDLHHACFAFCCATPRECDLGALAREKYGACAPYARCAAGYQRQLVPAASFLSVLSPDATAPRDLIYLAYVGAVLLAVGVLVLGVGLVRRPGPAS